FTLFATTAMKPPKPVLQTCRFLPSFSFVLTYFDPLPLFFFRPLRDASLLITERVKTAFTPFIFKALLKLPHSVWFSHHFCFPYTPETIYYRLKINRTDTIVKTIR
ncbi:MAG: hypothetical protein WAK60_01890, partial [Sedimentisphaerales bacterium]